MTIKICIETPNDFFLYYDMSQLKTGGIYMMIVCFSSLAEVELPEHQM